MIILDTNVMSESTRLKPSAIVREWFEAQDRGQLYVTTISQAEALFGLVIMPLGQKRSELQMTMTATFNIDYRGRILPFDSAAAIEFADIVAARRRAGKPMDNMDAQIAAIARAHGAALATRDVADFEGCGIALINPWAN